MCLKYLCNTHTVTIEGHSVAESDINSLINVKHLVLAFNSFTDEALKDLVNLEHLTLMACSELTNNCLLHLKSLKTICVRETKITKDAVGVLGITWINKR